MALIKEEQKVLDYLFKNMDNIRLFSADRQKEIMNGIKNILEPHMDIEISEEHQILISKEKELQGYLTKISNITAKTIISFCEGEKSHEEIDPNILFEIYTKRIKPRINEFKNYDSKITKAIKIAFLSVLKEEKILELLNPEIVKFHTELIESPPNLNKTEYKKVLSKNPLFISNIEDPSEDLQVFAVTAADMFMKQELLDAIENICDDAVAVILVDFNPKHSMFKGRFKDDVPTRLIDKVLEIKPSYAFNGKCKELFFKEVTLRQQLIALETSRYLFLKIPEEEITEDLIIKAIEEQPYNLTRVGEELGIYTTHLSNHARKYLPNLKKKDQKEALEVIEKYEQVIYDRDYDDAIYENVLIRQPQ